jgi:hypothetical protein
MSEPTQPVEYDEIPARELRITFRDATNEYATLLEKDKVVAKNGWLTVTRADGAEMSARLEDIRFYGIRPIMAKVRKTATTIVP